MWRRENWALPDEYSRKVASEQPPTQIAQVHNTHGDDLTVRRCHPSLNGPPALLSFADGTGVKCLNTDGDSFVREGRGWFGKLTIKGISKTIAALSAGRQTTKMSYTSRSRIIAVLRSGRTTSLPPRDRSLKLALELTVTDALPV